MAETIDLAGLSIISFDWDKGNREKNWLKHQVSTRECEEIFFNEPLHIFHDTKHSQQEERLVAYGKTDQGRYITAIFTVRNSKIRIISARNQNKKERRVYEETQTNASI